MRYNPNRMGMFGLKKPPRIPLKEKDKGKCWLVCTNCHFSHKQCSNLREGMLSRKQMEEKEKRILKNEKRAHLTLIK